MTESIGLQAFKRQKDHHKVAVKISSCTCVVLSWEELKVRQNLHASYYEIHIVCLLVATVYWHKLLQLEKKSSITLLPCLLLIRSVVKERVHASAKFRNTPRDKTKQNKTKQNKTQKNCVQWDTKVEANEV